MGNELLGKFIILSVSFGITSQLKALDQHGAGSDGNHGSHQGFWSWGMVFLFQKVVERVDQIRGRIDEGAIEVEQYGWWVHFARFILFAGKAWQWVHLSLDMGLIFTNQKFPCDQDCVAPIWVPGNLLANRIEKETE